MDTFSIIKAGFATLITIGVFFVLLRSGIIKKRTNVTVFNHNQYQRVIKTKRGYENASLPDIGIAENSNEFYVKKEPFDIEVFADDITAANGKRYRAMAAVTVFAPTEEAPKLVEMYHNKRDFINHNFDELIEEDLRVMVEDALQNVLINYNGEESAENLKSVFKSETLKRILIYHHLIANVPVFNMTEIKE